MQFNIQRFADTSLEEALISGETKLNVKMLNEEQTGTVSRTFSNVYNVMGAVTTEDPPGGMSASMTKYLVDNAKALVGLSKNTYQSSTYSISVSLDDHQPGPRP